MIKVLAALASSEACGQQMVAFLCSSHDFFSLDVHPYYLSVSSIPLLVRVTDSLVEDSP
jgi:hypothetical protein